MIAPASSADSSAPSADADLSKYDRAAASVVGQGCLAFIESQVGLAFGLVESVAGKAVLRQNRPHVAAEIDFAGILACWPVSADLEPSGSLEPEVGQPRYAAMRPRTSGAVSPPTTRFQ